MRKRDGERATVDAAIEAGKQQQQWWRPVIAIAPYDYFASDSVAPRTLTHTRSIQCVFLPCFFATFLFLFGFASCDKLITISFMSLWPQIKAMACYLLLLSLSLARCALVQSGRCHRCCRCHIRCFIVEIHFLLHFLISQSMSHRVRFCSLSISHHWKPFQSFCKTLLCAGTSAYTFIVVYFVCHNFYNRFHWKRSVIMPIDWKSG